MANRPLFTPTLVISNGDMSGNITSNPTIINWLSMVSYQVTWAGAAPVGNLFVETSNDYSLYPNGTVNNPGTWTQVPLIVAGTEVASIPISGSPGDGVIDLDLISTYAVRIFYSFTSGTGLMQATIAAKVS